MLWCFVRLFLNALNCDRVCNLSCKYVGGDSTLLLPKCIIWQSNKGTNYLPSTYIYIYQIIYTYIYIWEGCRWNNIHLYIYIYIKGIAVKVSTQQFIDARKSWWKNIIILQQICFPLRIYIYIYTKYVCVCCVYIYIFTVYKSRVLTMLNIILITMLSTMLNIMLITMLTTIIII